MQRTLCIGAIAMAVSATGWSQQLLVFPAVTDELPGLHGSLWVTNVRLVVANPNDEVTVQLAWVCLEDGGFIIEPSNAPTWFLGGGDVYGRVLALSGGSLLRPHGQVGAVGLVVEGGELIGHAYVADSRYGAYSSPDSNPHPPGPWAFGQGQLEPAMVEPLLGPSHIPWLGGCLNMPCSQDPPERWDYLRNNIGLVNPNPEPMTFVGTVIPFGYEWLSFPGGIAEFYQDVPETFTKGVPPYGWIQFRWEANTDSWGFNAGPPANGFIVSLTPDSDLPYYAYASVVFTPDPESGAPQFNDPMFVPAEPGFVAPLGITPRAEERPRDENR
jgi:hypothetical protein